VDGLTAQDIETRRVTVADAALFARVAPEVFDAAVDPARLPAYLAAPGHLMVVAMHEDKIVGQIAAVIHRHPDKATELYIDEVGVTPALQRRGIGHRLLREMLTWGKDLGCDEAWVGTETDNEAACGLYESLAPTDIRSAAPPETFVLYLYEL